MRQIAHRMAIQEGTVAFWVDRGGLPNDQFAPVNQLLVPVAFQISSCAHKTDNRKKRKPSVIANDQQLLHRESAEYRVKPFTVGSCNRLWPAVARIASRFL